MSSPEERFTLNDDDDVSVVATTSTGRGGGSGLTQAQIDRMENNRKRALELRAKKEAEKKTKKTKYTTDSSSSSSINKKLIDTGAGFYLDENDLIEEKKKEKAIKEPPAPPIDQQLLCTKCNKQFAYSFLSMNFDVNICDTCKTNNPEEYELITRTDAKEEFLLKDCDFDFREPVLKYILKKNPHNDRWGDMKLYLKFQCRDRSLVVHETEEKLEEKKEIKIHNLHKTRQKNYEKKIKDLRKQTRTASKKLTEFHQHKYGEEIYDKKKDVYYKICNECSHRLEYEEL